MKDFSLALIEKVPMMILGTTIEGDIQYVSEFCYSYTGFNSEQLLHQPISHFLKLHQGDILADVAKDPPTPKYGELTNAMGQKIDVNIKTIQLETEDSWIIFFIENISKNHLLAISMISESQQEEFSWFSKSLHDIHTMANLDVNNLPQCLSLILQKGLELYDLDVGIISHIKDDTYEIKALEAPATAGYQLGDKMPLENVLCNAVIKQKKAQYYNQKSPQVMTESALPSAYISFPITVQQDTWGTLNFSSSRMRSEPFNAYELELGQIMANIVSHYIGMHQAREELKATQEELAVVNKNLAVKNQYMLQEQYTAKDIFNKIIHNNHLESSDIKYHMSSFSIFNGDFLLAWKKPNGNVIIMLGDFTGHGLPAALGIIPISQIFYAMARKNFAMNEIICSMNERLRDILPARIFCCGLLIEADYQNHQLSVWNGGGPDILLFDQHKHLKQRFPSHHVALGVIEASEEEFQPQTHALVAKDSVYLLSDGIIEAQDKDGKILGVEAIINVITATNAQEDALAQILEFARTHANITQDFVGHFGDDTTVLEFTFVP